MLEAISKLKLKNSKNLF